MTEDQKAHYEEVRLMIENELGVIPEGLQVAEVNALLDAQLERGRATPKEAEVMLDKELSKGTEEDPFNISTKSSKSDKGSVNMDAFKLNETNTASTDSVNMGAFKDVEDSASKNIMNENYIPDDAYNIKGDLAASQELGGLGATEDNFWGDVAAGVGEALMAYKPAHERRQTQQRSNVNTNSTVALVENMSEGLSDNPFYAR